MARHKNLQPWMDYFRMLRTYENSGFLAMDADKHEAYVTLPALYTLAECEVPEDGQPSRYQRAVNALRIQRLVRRLRIYAAWQSTSGKDYLSYSFAVHIVKDDGKYDPMHTILLTHKRHWWSLWLKTDRFDIIDY